MPRVCACVSVCVCTGLSCATSVCMCRCRAPQRRVPTHIHAHVHPAGCNAPAPCPLHMRPPRQGTAGYLSRAYAGLCMRAGEQDRVTKRLNILALREGHFRVVDFLDRFRRYSVHLQVSQYVQVSLESVIPRTRTPPRNKTRALLATLPLSLFAPLERETSGQQGNTHSAATSVRGARPVRRG